MVDDMVLTYAKRDVTPIFAVKYFNGIKFKVIIEIYLKYMSYNWYEVKLQDIIKI